MCRNPHDDADKHRICKHYYYAYNDHGLEIVGVWNHQRAREYENMRMKNSSYGSDRMPVVVLASLEAEAFRQSIVP